MSCLQRAAAQCLAGPSGRAGGAACGPAQRHARPAARLATPRAAGDRPSSETNACISRRTLLTAAPCALLLAGLGAAPARATDAAVQLPKAYLENASKLVKTLRASIEADVGGLEEVEVRRLADPAKDLVREFMTRWRGSVAVEGDEAYRQITATIRDLGAFYMKAGQRARLDPQLGADLLARLEEAERLLPEPPPSKLFPF